MGMEPSAQGYVIPVLVGTMFGYFLLRMLRLRDEQRQSRAEIDDLNGRLRELVADRTSELRRTETHLHQAQKMEAIGRLAGGVAHDFNNLLTVVIGGTSLALRECPDGEARHLLNQVLDAANRGAGLTRQLLSFGKPQSALPKVLSVDEVVDDMVPMLRMALGRGTEISWQAGDDVPPVFIDKGLLGQVLMNLVVNARDAMPDGGKIEISTRRGGNGDEGRALLMVKDSGVGMDEDTRRRMLEPFFSTKPVGTGTGLGLSVAFGIVKTAGGEIRVVSEAGQGTEMIIDLPATRPVSATGPQLESTELSSGGGTVLVVDDDEAVLLTVGRGLVSGGYRVLSARDGTSAQQTLESRKEPVDLILCDVSLADGECGVDVARAALEHSPDAALIFMSGYTEERIADNQLTIEPLLQKPFAVEELLSRTQTALQQRQPAAVASSGR